MFELHKKNLEQSSYYQGFKTKSSDSTCTYILYSNVEFLNIFIYFKIAVWSNMDV